MSANRTVVALTILSLVGTNLQAADTPNPQTVARRVDELMAAEWKQRGVVPAAVADDAEFLRRASLDLTGRIPTAAAVREFLADTEADKRAKLIERLLVESTHHSHFARIWRELLTPVAGAPRPEELPVLENWLRERFATNTRYDQVARALLTTDLRANLVGNPMVSPPGLYLRFFGTDAGAATSSAARVFLGVRIECARCHNHPTESWSRDQFWQFAAVFTEMEPVAFRVAGRPYIEIPDTNRIVYASFPDGSPVKEKPGTPRDQLASWLADANNPFFAKAAVNRVWAIMVGSGFVDPPDDVWGETPTAHPAALDELARAFVASGFDLRFLIRTVAATQVYQFTSALSHSSQSDPRTFARMAVKPLSPDQLADSLAVAVGTADPADRAAVLDRFAGSSGETTIIQALWWMNGGTTARATTPARPGTLAAVSGNTKLDARGKVEALFLATLGRLPRTAETDRLAKYVESGGPRQDSARALADVFWMLLNCTEFSVNH